MAPEQLRFNIKLTAAADIHALAQMTYTRLVGKAYWADEATSAGDVIAFAMAAINGPQESAVARAARCGVTLPSGFDAWFAKGTAVNPADRFPSATEAIRALRAIGGSTSPGIAPMAPRPMMASDASMAAPVSRPALASAPMLERAVTSTGASAITAAPIQRSSRAPLVGAAAVLGLGVLATGAWLSLRQGHANPETTSQIAAAPSPAASAVTSAAPVVEVAPAAVGIPPAPSVTASALAAPAPAPTAPKAPSTGAVAGAKTPPKPAAAPKSPAATKPVADENYTRR